MRLIKKLKINSNLLYLVFGGSVGQATLALATPILTRLYDPELFGAFAQFVSVVGVLAVIASFRYEWLIAKQHTSSGAYVTLSLCFLVLLLSVILVSFASLIIALTGVNNEIVDLELVTLIPIALFFVSSFQILTFYQVKKGSFRVIALSKATQGITNALVSIALGLFIGYSYGLVVGFVSGYAIASIILTYNVRLLGKVSFKRMGVKAINGRDFPKYSAPSSLVNSLGVEAPVLLLASLYDLRVAGYYAVINRLIITPLGLLSRSWNQVYIKSLSDTLALQQCGCVLSLFKKNVFKLFALYTPILLIVAIFSFYFLDIILGDEWSDASYLILILMPSYLFYFIASPLSQTLPIMGYQKVQLVWDLIRLALVAFSFVFPYLMGMDWWNAILIYSILNATSYALLIYVTKISLKSKVALDVN